MVTNSSLYVLRSPEARGDAMCLGKLAHYWGIEYRAISTPPAADTPQGTVAHVAATCQSLDAFQRAPAARAWLAQRLAVPGSSIFVTGIGASGKDADVLRSLLPDAIEAVGTVSGPRHYTVAGTASDGLPYLEGLSFAGHDQADRVVVLKDPARATPFVTIAGKPAYVRVNRAGATVFLAACAEVLDLDEPVPPGVQPIDLAFRLFPFLAYLRQTFGARCWTNEAPAACLIIDDPLLRERYGFLDFRQLESRLAASPFSLNIAFIPWNYRRTDRRAAERFKRRDHRFSVSIHGCDHTRAEFSSADEAWLRRQARRALSRMETHQQLTGIQHNRVMVFPQGVFSKASLRALAAEGYVAAVNSTLYPVDAVPGDVTFGDFLSPAVMRSGGVPLFMRHYPERPEKIALDLFLGRPALIVEHHGFFRNGYEEVARCVDFVNRIAPRVRWTDLEDLCESTHLVRDAGDAQHVRVFSSSARLGSRHGERRDLRVERQCGAEPVDAVTWNGRAVHFDITDSVASCELALEAGETGILRFASAPNSMPIDNHVPSLADRLKVFARRHLCEVRDNYLDRSALLAEIAKAGKSWLPRA